jgi:KUP system potassium uptake protein
MGGIKNKASLGKGMAHAIGVVFGDIGTSPLYAFKSCFLLSGLAVQEANVLGVVSLLIWIIFIMVTIKYVVIVMRFDNQNDGGILVLANLCSKLQMKSENKKRVIALGIIGAALFVSDGVITPAISVLGALEGLTLVSHELEIAIIPLAMLILITLFYMQKRGSSALGNLFAPVLITWFVILFLLGLIHILQAPGILKALNPLYAIQLFWQNGGISFLVLGGAILVVTGAEALYADIGHFGKGPIRLAWLLFVFPALVVHYLGQGALVLKQPQAIENPFYYLVPGEALYPLIFLATVVCFIAAQAVISGVFSLSWQAIMLNYLPRMEVRHTSADHLGQVYVPTINKFLLILTLAAILIFRKAENLAIAYGLSVAGVMLITSFLSLKLAYLQLRWPIWYLAIIFSPIICLEIIFIGSNLLKIVHGAWYVLAISSAIMLIVYSWLAGNKIIQHDKQSIRQDISSFLNDYRKKYLQRIPGTAVFMSRNPQQVPKALIAHLHHNKFLHEKILCISIITAATPQVESKQRFSCEKICKGMYSITASYGFKEVPDLHRVLLWAHEEDILRNDEEALFFLSKTVPVSSASHALKGIFEAIYIALSKNAHSAYEFYKIPQHKVLELGIWHKV